MSVLVVDKPAGVTSFAVVKRIRRLLSRVETRWAGPSGSLRGRAWEPSQGSHLDRPGRTERNFKIGHGGTLDPLATGVLPICVGEATKLAAFLLDADKEYEAAVLFGVETDTLDADGRVVARHDVGGLSEAGVARALAGFLGSIDQTPPMFAALKRDGRPLYDYARAGLEVPRQARRVAIRHIELLQFEAPDRARFRVRCSKGTYIRVLAADLGRVLGTGAHLTALRRTASGPFGLDRALTMEEIERQIGEHGGRDLPFVSLSLALAHLPAVTVDEAMVAALTRGQKVSSAAVGLPSDPGQRSRLLRPDGTLLAVAEGGADGVARTLRVFNPES